MKRAILEISDILLVELLKGMKGNYCLHRFKVIKNGLPKDAKPIRCILPPTNSGVMGILIESEEFDNVDLGELYPILDATELETVYEE